MQFLSRFTRRRLVVLGGAILAVAVAAGFAVASIPDASGVLHACYKKEKGQLRLVESAADCLPSELAITWSQTGPTGAQGPTGATGATGPGVVPGGTAGQGLAKIDGTNYNTKWSTVWVSMTQAAYDALPVKDPNTLYVIVG